MNHTLSIVLLAVSVSACAFGKPDKPTPYTGPDTVSTAEPGDFIGTWQTEVINPLPGSETNATLVTYREDGSFSATITPEAESASPLNDTPFVIRGRWSTESGRITHDDVEIKSLGDDPLATVLATLLNDTRDDLGGTANLYERSSTHLILVSPDGVATRYLRQ